MTMWWMNPALVLVVFAVLLAVIVFLLIRLKFWKRATPPPDDPAGPRDFVRRKMAEELERSKQDLDYVKERTKQDLNSIQPNTLCRYRYPLNLNDFEYEMQNIFALHFGHQHPLYFYKGDKKYKIVFDETERMVQEVFE